MKHTVNDLNDPGEPAIYFSSWIEHYTFDSFFRNIPSDSTLVEDVGSLYEINSYVVVPFIGSIVHNVYNVNTNFRIDLSSWNLFFYGSKSKDWASVVCVLIDPKGTKIIIACRLEFECTNNIAEFEALVQGLRKEINLSAQVIECYGDSAVTLK